MEKHQKEMQWLEQEKENCQTENEAICFNEQRDRGRIDKELEEVRREKNEHTINQEKHAENVTLRVYLLESVV